MTAGELARKLDGVARLTYGELPVVIVTSGAQRPVGRVMYGRYQLEDGTIVEQIEIRP